MVQIRTAGYEAYCPCDCLEDQAGYSTLKQARLVAELTMLRIS